MFGSKSMSATTRADAAAKLIRDIDFAIALAQQRGVSFRAIADTLERHADAINQRGVMSTASTGASSSVEHIAALLARQTR